MDHSDASEPFRFLDLPKELRLIVYEYLRDLPVKRTHYELELVDLERINDNWWEKDRVQLRLVWDTIPELPVLYASRQIHSEASAVFRSKLAAIEKQPIRPIASIEVLISKYFIPLLVCLSSEESTCDLTMNPRKLLRSSQLGEHWHSPATAETVAPVEKRHIQIAIDDYHVTSEQSRSWNFSRKLCCFQGDVAEASKKHNSSRGGFGG